MEGSRFSNRFAVVCTPVVSRIVFYDEPAHAATVGPGVTNVAPGEFGLPNTKTMEIVMLTSDIRELYRVLGEVLKTVDGGLS